MATTGKRRATPKRKTGPIVMAGALTIALLGVGGVILANGSDEPPMSVSGPLKTEATPSDIPAKDVLRVSSLNVLAARHTAPKKKASKADTRPGAGKPARKRTPVELPAKSRYVDQVATRHGLDVFGVQGLSSTEITGVTKAGSKWASYPIKQPRAQVYRAAVTWRTDVWRRVGADTKRVMLGKTAVPVPYVKLRHKKSQRELYVINVPERARKSPNDTINGTTIAAQLSADGTPHVFTGSAARDSQPENAAKPTIESMPDPFGNGDPLQVAKASLSRTESSSSFRVGSYNILGSDHTGNFGKPGNGGSNRMNHAIGNIRARNLDVVGFQEMQSPQRAKYKAATGWPLYPDSRFRDVEGHNSIGWNPSVWELVSAHTEPITYFKGEIVQMPYILLKHKASGEEVYFANFHNPATTKRRGNNKHWRNVATAREISLFKRLRATGKPLIVTGDMNEKHAYYCPVTAATDLRSAGGGSTSPCAPAAPVRIDWVFGSNEITFSDYAITGDSRASDHQLISAEASLASIAKPAEFNLGDLVLSPGTPAADMRPWAPANVRIRSAYEALESNHIDVVGFQELTPTQFTGFKNLSAENWDSYPRALGEEADTRSTIAWRTSTWALVPGDSGAFTVPGSGKQTTKVPWVKLRNVETSEEVYVVNTFNPVGRATEQTAAWRRQADAKVLAMVEKLAKQGIPVLVTGGLTQAAATCAGVDSRQLKLAAKPDQPPCSKGKIATKDQILGTSGVSFTNFSVVRDQAVREATDAALITADARVDSKTTSGNGTR
ncbi:MAG: endonuclease/exonuclease/phosphatase family protein [Nocardioidaceae bacterium]|nr:MAG: endonuclease/exonuclease/phosphatase family protein [Nocardioidaceae bacterium]